MPAPEGRSRVSGATAVSARRCAAPPERPRLSVFRSSRHVYAQVIDDVSGPHAASASTMEKDARERARPATVDAAKAVGKRVGRAREGGRHHQSVVFDRGGFRYHGRVAGSRRRRPRSRLEF